MQDSYKIEKKENVNLIHCILLTLLIHSMIFDSDANIIIDDKTIVK